MTRVLVLFLDGVGLGKPDPDRNPFVRARMPGLQNLLGGRHLVAGAAPFEGPLATMLSLDATLGVPGRPQSASGQAALLTGKNIPAAIGSHYGPKPNGAIASILREENLFRMVVERGGTAALLNAYPPRYFDSILSGRRLYSAIPLAAHAAGLTLMTAEDLQQGRALSADFTGEGWAAQPQFPPAPVYTPLQAGHLLGELARRFQLTWFDYWPSDYVGHRGNMDEAIALLELLDAVLAALIEAWGRRRDLLVITSDHGNLEDLSRRGHTENPVPAILVGPKRLRQAFAGELTDLTRFAPSVLRVLFDGSSR